LHSPTPSPTPDPSPSPSPRCVTCWHQRASVLGKQWLRRAGLIEFCEALDELDECTARQLRRPLIRRHRPLMTRHRGVSSACWDVMNHPRTLTRSYTADIRTQSWVPTHPAPDCPQLHLHRARTAPLWARLCSRHWRAHPPGDLPTSAPGLRPHRGTVDGQYVFTGMVRLWRTRTATRDKLFPRAGLRHRQLRPPLLLPRQPTHPPQRRSRSRQHSRQHRRPTRPWKHPPLLRRLRPARPCPARPLRGTASLMAVDV